MKKSDFDYYLPENLIAQYPLKQRSQSRLMVLERKTRTIHHCYFHQIDDWLQSQDLLILNDTKVIPARLKGKKSTGGKVEVFIERVLENHQAIAMIASSKPSKAGQIIYLQDAIPLKVLERKEEFYLVEFPKAHSVHDWLEKIGEVPLPPYMARDAERDDQERYQTVFARYKGSVAAPTAGLHFDKDLLEKLKHQGINHDFVTLHVGAGTFLPMRVENIYEHKMHTEWLEVPAATCDRIKKTKAQGGRVIAVGTTSTRSLETAAKSGEIMAYQGDTNLFIYPGYQFKVVDALVTNFHLPQSTLLMLVSAFAGKEFVLQAYQEAVEQQYRFFSYGDAMLIL